MRNNIDINPGSLQMGTLRGEHCFMLALKTGKKCEGETQKDLEEEPVQCCGLFTLAGIFLAASRKIKTWLIWCFSAENSHTQSQWHLCEGLQLYSHLREQIMQFLAPARKIPASVNTPLWWLSHFSKEISVTYKAMGLGFEWWEQQNDSMGSLCCTVLPAVLFFFQIPYNSNKTSKTKSSQRKKTWTIEPSPAHKWNKSGEVVIGITESQKILSITGLSRDCWLDSRQMFGRLFSFSHFLFQQNITRHVLQGTSLSLLVHADSFLCRTKTRVPAKIVTSTLTAYRTQP